MLVGLRKPDWEREAAILKKFWELFRCQNPDHPVFEQSRLGNLDLGKTFPMVFHGDEGRGRKHTPQLVLNFHSVLGRGVRVKNKKKAGSYIKMSPNFHGHSLTTRFLLAAVPKVLYSWDNDEVWQDLMQLATDEANFMFYEGVLDGTCRRGKFNMALLFISGDWPWLADSGNLARSYRNVQKKKNQQRHLGICHMCAAGQTGYDFEEINSRQPQWLRTMFTLDCFSQGGPPPFADLPHVPGRLAELWRFDAFHTLHLGVCKIFLSSSLALLSELQPESAIDDRFASLSALYLSWCKTHSERPWVSKLTKELLNWPSTTVFPTGSWHKGALSTTLMRWFQFRFEREGSNWPPMLARAGEACVLMNDFLKGLYDAEAWLPASTAQKIAENGFAFLIQCARLARMAYLEGRLLWSLQPKLHCLHHLVIYLFESSVSGHRVLNILCFSTQQDEDFVGRPSRLARRVTPKVLQSCHRVLDRYLIATHSQWVKDRYLLTPEASAGSVSRWNWCILSHLLIYVFYIFSPIIIYIINIYSLLYPWVAVYIYICAFVSALTLAGWGQHCYIRYSNTRDLHALELKNDTSVLWAGEAENPKPRVFIWNPGFEARPCEF